jgi:hypothetical protein
VQHTVGLSIPIYHCIASINSYIFAIRNSSLYTNFEEEQDNILSTILAYDTKLAMSLEEMGSGLGE